MDSKCPGCGYDPEIEVIWSREFTIKETWPSQNQLSANIKGRGGWSYRKWRKKFEAAIPQATGPEVAGGPRRLWLVRYYGYRKRCYDYANLVGGGKPLVDTLCSRSWLLDDNPLAMTAYYKQVKSPTKECYIEIRIEDCTTKSVE